MLLPNVYGFTRPVSVKRVDYERVSMLTATFVRRLSPMRIVVGKVGVTVR